jgi:long-chain acyl-CoA synthetase
VRTTESWWLSFTAYGELTGVGRGARVWVPGPVTATMNLFAAVHADWAGAELVDHPADASHACVTPAVLDRRLDELAPMSAVTVAGASLPRALAGRAEAAGHSVAHYYGAAELSFVASGRDAESLTAFPGVRIEIRDSEIWVRSPYVARGEGGPLRRDGAWATVGDLGRLEGTRLVVSGRPDAVLTAGVTVVLAEVEGVLSAAAARPLACFGVDRASVGQVLAVVVTDPADLPTLREVAHRTLGAGHRPRLWFVAEGLPLTVAGKVDRRALGALAAAGRLRRG